MLLKTYKHFYFSAYFSGKYTVVPRCTSLTATASEKFIDFLKSSFYD